MSDQEQPRKLKKKQKSSAKPDIEFRVGETFEPSKEADFDLSLKEMLYQAKKGQAGSRTKSPEAGGSEDRATD
jgi:hypothetical protein